MDKGSEGDEILIFACRDIGCTIPTTVTTIGQLTADTFIQIISKSLALISNGDVQVPATLPQNIAVRHRICTDIALKIKDLGYLGDCGYNQLLYPVEHQTRDLLKWIVDKLPRSAEEGTEEIVGAGAILNRNITQALTKWQKALWTLPACQSGKPLTNIYKRIPFSLKDNNNQVNLAASLLNRHALEKTIEQRKAEELNRRFLKTSLGGGSSSSGGGKDGTGAGNDENDDSQVLKEKILASLKEADDAVKASQKKNAGGGASNAGTTAAGASDPSTDVEGGDTEGDGSSSKTAAQMSLTFQELIKSITEQANENESNNDFQGTRFAHATVFAHEADDGGINAAVRALGTVQIGGGTGSSVAGAGNAGGGNFNNNLAAASAALAAQGGGGVDGTGKVTGPPLDRKAQQELEEKQRQEEIRLIRNEIESLATSLENEMKVEDDLLKVVEEYENSLEELNNEAETLEKECLLRKKVLEMMPSAADNIAKLEAICEKSGEKLRNLEKEWRTVEDPLVAEITKKENVKIERVNKVSEMIEDIKRYRELMGPMLHDLKERQERAQLLADEKAKLPKNLNRALYTHRIMDITSSLAKQNKEVDKITNDIRDLQKTINLNTNTLQRADAVTEELIFSAASDKNDPVMVDTYRRLKSLRAAFESLIESVNGIGQTEKQTRDYETKIDAEKNRVASYNFDRIQADLEAIMKENQQLLNQVKALSK